MPDTFTRNNGLSENDIIQLCHMIHYPGHWDTFNYPTLMDALIETIGDFHCTTCEENQKVISGSRHNKF